MNRRAFLRSAVAMLAAPAIVRAESLMPLYVPPKLVIWADGVHDDWAAAQAVLDGGTAQLTNGIVISSLNDVSGRMFVGQMLRMRRDNMNLRGLHLIGNQEADGVLSVSGKNVSVEFCRFESRGSSPGRYCWQPLLFGGYPPVRVVEVSLG